MWDGGPIPDELRVFPGYLLARLGEASSRRFRMALEPEALHPRHFGVMTMVASHPGMSQQELHEKTAIDPSSMVAVMEKLDRVRALVGKLQRDFFQPLSAEERHSLHALLRKLATAS